MAQNTAKLAGSSSAFAAICFITFVWLVTGPIFHWSDTWQLVINTVTNIVSMLMVFVIQNTQNRESSALHLKIDELRVDEFYGMLSTYPHLYWIAPDLKIADLAARFRASYRLRTPDALQAATAAHALATGLITNDPAFERVETFETLVLDNLL